MAVVQVEKPKLPRRLYKATLLEESPVLEHITFISFLSYLHENTNFVHYEHIFVHCVCMRMCACARTRTCVHRRESEKKVFFSNN